MDGDRFTVQELREGQVTHVDRAGGVDDERVFCRIDGPSGVRTYERCSTQLAPSGLAGGTRRGDGASTAWTATKNQARPNVTLRTDHSRDCRTCRRRQPR